MKNQLVLKILDYLSYEDYQDGDRLPSERLFAEQLNTSRNTLREALKVLQTLDVLESRRGSGIYLKRANPRPGDNETIWLVVHKNEILDILIIREALEQKAIELIQPQEYRRIGMMLHQSIERVKKSEMDNRAFLAHDLDFHNIFCAESKNEMLLKISEGLINKFYDERLALYQMPKRISLSLDEHIEIADAFLAEQLNGIINAHRKHIMSTRETVEDAELAKT